MMIHIEKNEISVVWRSLLMFDHDKNCSGDRKNPNLYVLFLTCVICNYFSLNCQLFYLSGPTTKIFLDISNSISAIFQVLEFSIFLGFDQFTTQVKVCSYDQNVPTPPQKHTFGKPANYLHTYLQTFTGTYIIFDLRIN